MVNKDGKCIARPQGQSVPKTVDGSKIHQWQGVLLPTCGNNHQEDLHHDGGAIMYNGRTAITRRGYTRGLQDDKMDEGDTDDHNDGHDEGGRLMEVTPPLQIYKGIRKLHDETLHKRTTAVLQLQEVWPRGQDLQVQCPDLEVLCRKTRIHPVRGQQNSHTKVCQLRTGAFQHQSALPKETGSQEQSKDFVHTSNKETYNPTR